MGIFQDWVQKKLSEAAYDSPVGTGLQNSGVQNAENIGLRDALNSVQQTLHNYIANSRSMKLDWSEPINKVRLLMQSAKNPQTKEQLSNIYQMIGKIADGHRNYAVALERGHKYRDYGSSLPGMAERFEREAGILMQNIDQAIKHLLNPQY